jgi:hypothetical protein
LEGICSVNVKETASSNASAINSAYCKCSYHFSELNLLLPSGLCGNTGDNDGGFDVAELVMMQIQFQPPGERYQWVQRSDIHTL